MIKPDTRFEQSFNEIFGAPYDANKTVRFLPTPETFDRTNPNSRNSLASRLLPTQPTLASRVSAKDTRLLPTESTSEISDKGCIE